MHPIQRTNHEDYPMPCSLHRSLVKITAALALVVWAAIGVASAADVAIESDDGASRVVIRSKPPSVVVEDQSDRVYDGSGNADAPPKPRSPKRASITIGDDGDFTSFSQLVESDPWLAALIFMSVALFFLVPIVLVIGIIWYKLRKTRLQNESMLALAERGLAPPAPPAPPGAPAGATAGVVGSAPVYEQVVATRKRTSISDLRKGVLLIAFGLAFTMYSLMSDRDANWLGLTLLFVGTAYVVLWWVEERNANPQGGPTAGSN
jgi:hypothetical protein